MTVISPCDVWVAGFSFSNGANQDLIEHWNGIAWRVVPSPDPGTDNNFLTGIRAVSPSSIWAVGAFNSGGGSDHTLILHWDGKSWQQMESPSPGDSADLNAVRAVSASSVWAVGNFSKGGKEKTLILHWNGHQWRQQASPNPGTLNALTGIAVTSAADAWAVGFAGNGFAEQTLILHWNGRKWSRVASPDLGGPRNTNSLNGVAATSASNVWAVGIATHGGQNNTLILRWNGTKWTHVPSPDPGSSNDLDAVAASSAANAWAVGSFNGVIHQTLAIHCC
ncbi:MAG TPA: hypothetical protein VGM14_13610 [Streptosporangiaceae bacterium]